MKQRNNLIDVMYFKKRKIFQTACDTRINLRFVKKKKYLLNIQQWVSLDSHNRKYTPPIRNTYTLAGTHAHRQTHTHMQRTEFLTNYKFLFQQNVIGVNSSCSKSCYLKIFKDGVWEKKGKKWVSIEMRTLESNIIASMSKW